MTHDKRTPGFWLLAAFFVAYVLFLYGPMLVIVVLSFQGPEGGLTADEVRGLADAVRGVQIVLADGHVALERFQVEHHVLDAGLLKCAELRLVGLVVRRQISVTRVDGRQLVFAVETLDLNGRQG